MTLTAGTVLNGRYELVEQIAVGGMGEVWRASDSVLGRDVAVKCLKPEYADDPSFTARFALEARHTAGLSHPGIASVYDFGESEGTAYLVMELVQGEPLSALLRREGRLSTQDTLTIVGQAATALHAAHTAGVIHRDVKPGNILVTPDRGVKVTDFGIARAMNAVPTTQTGMVVGTAHYLSPEQGSGGEITPASDVYSLGVVAYECLAGVRPFDGQSAVRIAMAHINDEPPPLPDDVDESARMLVEQAMAKSPTERFANAGAFARATALLQQRLEGSITEPLAQAVAAPTQVIPLGGGDPVTVAAPLPDAGHRRTSRTPLLVALGVIALLLLIAGVVAATRPAPTHLLPALHKKPQGEAHDILERIDVGAKAVNEASRTVRKGVVIRTDPPAGTRVAEGSEVTLFVSAGPKPVSLPAGLTDMNVDQAVAALKRLNLTVTTASVENSEPAGTVLDVKPSTGLVEGNAVQVVVSSGPPREDPGKGKGKDKEEAND